MATQFENGLTMNQLAERNAVLVSELEKLRAELDASLNAERVWEKTMMEVCGEDGPASVAAVIKALTAENVGLKDTLEYVINPDNQPEYHDQGMGCGVEDHGYQRDGYSACAYGWESAIERVYSEVIPDAIPETPATDRIYAGIKADGVLQYAENLDSAADDAERGGYDDAVKCLRSEASAARLFAAQLRKGAAK